MKTRDSISKKRQRLSQEIIYWETRSVESLASVALNAEEREKNLDRARFCRQEAAKRREDLRKLAGGTLWQRKSGWQ